MGRLHRWGHPAHGGVRVGTERAALRLRIQAGKDDDTRLVAVVLVLTRLRHGRAVGTL